MKLLIAVLMTLFFALNAFADSEALVKSVGNFDVKMGELTGAGTRYTLKAIAGFVHPNGYILKSDCQNIVVKNSVDPKVSDVVRITVDNQVIEASELTGFIIQK